MTLMIPLLLSLFLTIVLVPVVKILAVRLQIYDMPGPRKVHRQPIPRIGGIAMAIGAFVSIIFWAPLDEATQAYLMGGIVLVVVGVVDDWRGLNFKAKFAGQILAALIAVFYGGIGIEKLGLLLPDGMILPGWASAILTVLVLVGVINAINLADGLDGLAAGISLLIFGFICYLAYTGQNMNVAVLSASLMGVCFGFLRFNTFPATLFMGDTGSQLMGFSAACFSLILTQGDTALSPLIPLIILGFPILDTLSVMGERIAQGRSPFSADRRHFHHRLLKMGFFHTEAVFVIYLIQTLLIASAYLLRFYSEWLLLGSYAAFATMIIVLFRRADGAGWRLQRFDFIDRVVKGRLKLLREQGVFIRIVFRLLSVSVPLLMIFAGCLPMTIPGYFSAFTALLLIAVFLVFTLRRKSFKLTVICSAYLFIPALVCLGDTEMAPWMAGVPTHIYFLAYLLLLFLGLLTLRLTKRKKGFRATPTDFLILVFMLVFLVIPQLRANYGIMAMKTIILYFCYEIIMGEYRERIGQVAALTVAAYLVVAIRGLVG